MYSSIFDYGIFKGYRYALKGGYTCGSRKGVRIDGRCPQVFPTRQPLNLSTGAPMAALRATGWAVCLALVLLSCYLAYDIRLYAIRTYGLVIHEFGAPSALVAPSLPAPPTFESFPF